MSVLSILSALPDFLPAEASAFTRSLCKSAELTANVVPTSLPETLPEAAQMLLALYGSFAKVLETRQIASIAAEKRLKSWGVWEQYSREDLPITLERALQPLRGIVTAFPAIETDLREGRVPQNIVFRSAWHFFCFRYGHRGLYEGDIAVSRFRETPQKTFAQALALAPLRKYDDEFPNTPKTSWKSRLLSQQWNRYAAEQHEIELLRSETMKRSFAIRLAMLEQASDLVRTGRLENTDALWNYSIDDLVKL
jgi:hypothetical protein